MLNNVFPYQAVIANSKLESALDWLEQHLPDYSTNTLASIETWRTNYTILGETVTVYFRTQEDQALFALGFL